MTRLNVYPAARVFGSYITDMSVMSYIGAAVAVIIIMTGVIALIMSTRVGYLPWGRFLMQNGMLTFVLGVIFLVFVCGVTLITIEARHQDDHARAVARAKIPAQLKMIESIVGIERQYYHQNQAFTDDLSVLYSDTADASSRKLLIPLVVDGHAKNFQLQLIGDHAAPASSLKITTDYHSRHFGQSNDYSLFLHAQDDGFSIEKLCSAHYYCVDHEWTALPSASKASQ